MRHFYDPGFAIATAILSGISCPVWSLMFGSLRVGGIFTIFFALFVLAMMLKQSWNMAHEEPSEKSR